MKSDTFIQPMSDIVMAAATPDDAILFYGRNLGYPFLSNCWYGGIRVTARVSGVLRVIGYASTEHAYQAMKYVRDNPELAERIRNAGSFGEVGRLGRSGTGIHPEWDIGEAGEKLKDRVMYVVVKAKFTQNPSLGVKLLETGTLRLVEHTRNDKYWADGGAYPDMKGLNRLGITLERVRDEIRSGDMSVPVIDLPATEILP